MKYIKRHVKRIELIVEVLFLIVLFLLGLFLESEFAASLFWQFYLFMGVLALILLLPIYLQSRRKQELWLFIGFNISLVTLHFLTLNPVKPFTQFYLDAKNGMTIQEVQSVFNQRFPKGGRFSQPEWELNDEHNEGVWENRDPKEQGFVAIPDQNLNYILDPNNGDYNAEIVTVYFKDGKVVGAKYLPD